VSYAAKATLSLLVSIAAAVAMMAVPGTAADVIGGTVAVAALVIFMRALMSLASASYEAGTGPTRRPPDSSSSHQVERVSLHDFDQGEPDAHHNPRGHHSSAGG
jgi:hypothetical protein